MNEVVELITVVEMTGRGHDAHLSNQSMRVRIKFVIWFRQHG